MSASASASPLPVSAGLQLDASVESSPQGQPASTFKLCQCCLNLCATTIMAVTEMPLPVLCSLLVTKPDSCSCRPGRVAPPLGAASRDNVAAVALRLLLASSGNDSLAKSMVGWWRLTIVFFS